jgi:hypothetical protein
VFLSSGCFESSRVTRSNSQPSRGVSSAKVDICGIKIDGIAFMQMEYSLVEGEIYLSFYDKNLFLALMLGGWENFDCPGVLMIKASNVLLES